MGQICKNCSKYKLVFFSKNLTTKKLEAFQSWYSYLRQNSRTMEQVMSEMLKRAKKTEMYRQAHTLIMYERDSDSRLYHTVNEETNKTIYAILKKQTDKAFFFKIGNRLEWLPKSYTLYNADKHQITIPKWLYDDKKLENKKLPTCSCSLQKSIEESCKNCSKYKITFLLKKSDSKLKVNGYNPVRYCFLKMNENSIDEVFKAMLRRFKKTELYKESRMVRIYDCSTNEYLEEETII